MAWDNGYLTRVDVAGEAEPATEKPAGPSTAADPAGLLADSHQVHVQDLYDAIRQGRPPLVSARDGRETVEIIKAIYLSSREGGATIELPLRYEDDGPGL